MADPDIDPTDEAPADDKVGEDEGSEGMRPLPFDSSNGEQAHHPDPTDGDHPTQHHH